VLTTSRLLGHQKPLLRNIDTYGLNPTFGLAQGQPRLLFGKIFKMVGLMVDAPRTRILDWISANKFNVKHQKVKESRVADSGNWILSRVEFERWIVPESPRILYCPGYGTSLGAFLSNIASWGRENIYHVRVSQMRVSLTHKRSRVIDHLEATFSQGVGLAFFYFSYDDQANQSTSAILRSILRQWLNRQSTIHSDVRSLYASCISQSKLPDLSDLLQCLKSVSTGFRLSFIVIDALDECEGPERENFLRIFSELESTSIRIFATSRPHLRDVEEVFRGSPRINIAADVHDLQRYLAREINLRMLSYPEDLRNSLLNGLSVQADGL
jgi:hypothetical protein